MKRFLDIIFSLLFIILLSPIMLIVAVLILILDGKPVLFCQKRVGYNNKLFSIYKFRTMKNNTEEDATALLKNIDSHITKLGKILRKLSIDEMPQFFNVLKGDMSFIGPRPLIPKENEIRELRAKYNVYSVKPGITGLAQINGRDNLSDEQKALFDKEYVENQSLKMDFKILVKTVINVISSKDVNDNCKKISVISPHDKLKVMSFNILCLGNGEYEWQKRAPHVVELIKKNNPDLLGVQEATPDWMEYLKENLSDFDHVGLGREDDKGDGEHSAIFYNKDRFILENADTFWLSETPREPSFGWDAACKRVCTWAILRDAKTTKKLIFFNTHTDHVGKIALKNGIKLILEKIKKISFLPVLLSGDFNLKEGSSNYNVIVNSGLVRDTKYSCDNTMNSVTFNGFDNEEPCIIDYIFANDKFNTLKYYVETEKNGELYISDHYPVIAELEFK